MSESTIGKLRGLSGQVLEPVPQWERSSYVFWRSSNMGALALRFAEGKDTVNNPSWDGRDTDGIVHFTHEYSAAQSYATTLPKGTSGSIDDNTQFPASSRLRLQELTGAQIDFEMPYLIFGLDHNSVADSERKLVFEQRNDYGDVYTADPVLLDYIDPHSKLYLNMLLDLQSGKPL